MTNEIGAFVDEAEGTPRPFVYRGHEYELPASLPAIVFIRASRFRRTGADADDDVAGEMLFEMLDQLFGQELLDQIVTECRIGVTELGELLQAAIAAYGVGEPGNREARRASPRGGRSTSRSSGRK